MQQLIGNSAFSRLGLAAGELEKVLRIRATFFDELALPLLDYERRGSSSRFDSTPGSRNRYCRPLGRATNQFRARAPSSDICNSSHFAAKAFNRS